MGFWDGKHLGNHILRLLDAALSSKSGRFFPEFHIIAEPKPNMENSQEKINDIRFPDSSGKPALIDL